MKLNGSLIIDRATNIDGLIIEVPLTSRLKNFLERKCQAKVEVDTGKHTVIIHDASFFSKKIKVYNELCAKFNTNPALESPYQQFEEKLLNLEAKINEFEQYGIKIQHNHGLKSFQGYGKSDIIKLVIEKLKKEVDNFEEHVESHLNFRDKNAFDTFNEQIKKIISTYKPAFEEHRHPSKVFIYNLLIALTIIGAIFIAAKLLYSKFTTGRSEYFFNQTQSSKYSSEILQLSESLKH